MTTRTDSTQPPVTVVGEVCLHVLVDGLPRPEVHLGSIEVCLGGPAAVVAAQLGRLRTPSRLVAAVGADPMGAMLAEELRSSGVDCTTLVRRGRTTRVVASLLDGEVQLAADISEPGDVVGPADLARAQLPSGGLVYVTGFPALLPAVRWLGDAGHRLVADVGFVPLLADIAALIAHVRVVAPYCDTVVISGSALSTEERSAVVTAAREAGADNVLVTLAAEGVDVYSGAEPAAHLPASRVDAVDPLCAGDVFTAGYLAARARGDAVRDAAQFGQQVAATKVTMFGRLPGFDDLPMEVPA